MRQLIRLQMEYARDFLYLTKLDIDTSLTLVKAFKGLSYYYYYQMKLIKLYLVCQALCNLVHQQSCGAQNLDMFSQTGAIQKVQVIWHCLEYASSKSHALQFTFFYRMIFKDLEATIFFFFSKMSELVLENRNKNNFCVGSYFP